MIFLKRNVNEKDLEMTIENFPKIQFINRYSQRIILKEKILIFFDKTFVLMKTIICIVDPKNQNLACVCLQKKKTPHKIRSKK